MRSEVFPLPWFLVGLPGSGKSRLGKRLAAELGIEHIDIDLEIERRENRSILKIFDEDGEMYFRELEARIIDEMAQCNAVISLGGGAVESETVRNMLSGRTVIWVDADVDELTRRVKRNRNRPLLRKDPVGTLKRLAERRNPWYQQLATIHVRSSRAPIDSVVRQAMKEAQIWREIEVSGTEKYKVIAGNAALNAVTGHIPRDATKVFLVLPETLRVIATPLINRICEHGLEVVVFEHLEGEAAKDLNVVSRAWDLMGSSHITRRDIVITFGGGATTDMGGFLAATWLRGILVIHVPTSLLAMVDASIGGKTGINTAAGKNLVGSFYDPILVVADTGLLKTLPAREYTAGLAEIIKAGFIDDVEILEIFRRDPKVSEASWATGPGLDVLTDVIERAITTKVRVVGEDRLESGLREILNYGHTLAHAIEKIENYDVRHGEAVAIGCVFAAELSRCLGMLTDEDVDMHREIFSGAGLPTSYEGSLDRILEVMQSDKKIRSDGLRFVVLSGIGKPEILPISENMLRRVAPLVGINAN